MNRFLYAEANPASFIDPSGHCVYDANTHSLSGTDCNVQDTGYTGATTVNTSGCHPSNQSEANLCQATGSTVYTGWADDVAARRNAQALIDTITAPATAALAALNNAKAWTLAHPSEVVKKLTAGGFGSGITGLVLMCSHGMLPNSVCHAPQERDCGFLWAGCAWDAASSAVKAGVGWLGDRWADSGGKWVDSMGKEIGNHLPEIAIIAGVMVAIAVCNAAVAACAAAVSEVIGATSTKLPALESEAQAGSAESASFWARATSWFSNLAKPTTTASARTGSGSIGNNPTALRTLTSGAYVDAAGGNEVAQTQSSLPGGWSEAQATFQQLTGQTVPSGQTVSTTIVNGVRYTVRLKSSGGWPTIDVFDPAGATLEKIRFGMP